jgi:hypothetical protein
MWNPAFSARFRQSLALAHTRIFRGPHPIVDVHRRAWCLNFNGMWKECRMKQRYTEYKDENNCHIFCWRGRRQTRYSDWLRAGQPRGRSSSPCRVKNFLFSTSSRPALGSTQPHILWVQGALSPGVKLRGHEADNSPPASVEVKKMWIYTSTPPYAFMA